MPVLRHDQGEFGQGACSQKNWVHEIFQAERNFLNQIVSLNKQASVLPVGQSVWNIVF